MTTEKRNLGGRPPKGYRARASLRLPPDLLEQAHAMAAVAGCPLNDWIIKAMETAIASDAKALAGREWHPVTETPTSSRVLVRRKNGGTPIIYSTLDWDDDQAEQGLLARANEFEWAEID